MSQNYAAGALTQLVARGAMDMFLTDSPESTYWRSGFTRCTAFSMETVEQNFEGSVRFGHNVKLKVQRTGDLLFHMYLKLIIPGIHLKINDSGARPFGDGKACEACTGENSSAYGKSTADEWRAKNYHGCDSCDDDNSVAVDHSPVEDEELDNCNWCHWANAIGQLIIEQCSLRVGGQQVDSMFGEFMFCWEELSGRVGRRLLEMVGKRYTRKELIIDAREERTLYVPLPFWFTQASGSALAIASLQFHDIELSVDFRKLDDLIVVNTPRLPDGKGYEVVKCGRQGGTLHANALRASLLSTYVYLEEAERTRFSNANFETLIVQHQHYNHDCINSKVQRITLPFNHPVIELIWFVRRKCNADAHNWFNFSGLECRDPLKGVDFHLNNQQRFGHQEASYYRLVQPYQVHSCIPDAFVYCYSFALHPEDSTTPSGSCNFSRIDNAIMTLTLQDGLEREQTEIWVYATSWNVARHRQGLLGIAYSN